MTPTYGSVINGQQILVMFMRRVSSDRVKQVMHTIYRGYVYPQCYCYAINWLVSEGFAVKFHVCLTTA